MNGEFSGYVREQVQLVDATLPVFGAQMLKETVAASLAERQFSMEIVGLFAVTALPSPGPGCHRRASSTRRPCARREVRTMSGRRGARRRVAACEEASFAATKGALLLCGTLAFAGRPLGSGRGGLPLTLTRSTCQNC
jgi:hypothetical protein